MVYRSNKYNWTAQPLTQPALYTYSKTRDRMAFWVSWNGATEVRSWNFYVGNTAKGPWTNIGNRPKTGFETECHYSNVTDWAYAEALDESGRVLAESVIQRTFVPSPTLVNYCDDRGCDHSGRVAENHTIPYEAHIDVDQEYLSPNRGFNTSNYYQQLPKSAAKGISQDHSGNKHSNVNVGIVVGTIGLIIGFGVAVFGYFLWTRGAFHNLEPMVDTIHRKTMDMSESVTRSAFGSKVLGKYTKVREKEMDGSESGGSSSSRGSRGLA